MRWISSHSWPAVAARRLSLALMLALPLSLALAPLHVQAVGCMTSSPASGAYTISLCFTKPADGATLTGVSTVAVLPTVTGSNPGIQRLIFYLAGQHLLIDYEAPYTFDLPSDHFVDKSYVLAVGALMRDGFMSQQASITLHFSNGVTQPPVNRNTFTPSSGTTPAAGRPFVLAAVGDGASGETNATNVTNLIASWNPNLMLYLGDVYENGTSTEFYNWYGTGTKFYSRFRAITDPTIGNHEYQNEQARGYFDYWDNIPHYYSYNAAGWHLISLDANSQFGQTAPNSAQYQWLLNDLHANSANCTLAYWHQPVYNVGPEGAATNMQAIWALLAQHGVDLVLNGHDHDYQRWMPLNENGQPDPNGMTEIIVGSGGHGIQGAVRSDTRLAIAYDTAPHAFGALRLELNRDGTAYQFVNTQGTTLDSGSVACSGAPPDTTSPNTPTDLIATAPSSNRVELTWTAATDNVGVIGYDLYRDGTLVATTDAATNYTDTTLAGGTAYEYRVRARDASGNVSVLSAIATVRTQTLLFGDGFESGNLSNWTTVSGLVIQQQERFAGVYAARGTSAGRATYAYKQLSVAQNQLYYRIWFKILSQGVNTMYLQRFRTATNSSLLGVFVSSGGTLGYRNDVTGVSTISTTSVASGSWHELQVYMRVNGANGQVKVWLDGNQIAALSKSEALGTTPIGRIQLGENASGRTYDIAFDNVAVDNSFIATSDISSPSVTLTEPPIGASVRGAVTLAADASDNVAVDRVEFLVNGTVVGTDYLAPYSASWNSTTSSDGAATVSARAVDTSANMTTATSRTVIVDNTAPNTTISSGPSGSINARTASFSFTANEPGVTFDCSLDGDDFIDCASPQSYSNLAAGSHTFQVIASDAAGNTDPTPACRSWTVVIPQPSHSSKIWLPLVVK